MQNNWNYDKNSKKIIIPDGTTSIPDEAFLNFDKLEEVVIPNSVDYIGTAAFKGCKSLKKINLPNKLQLLGTFAFSECESLEEITIPSSLQYFSYGVFSHCHNLKTVNIHNNIKYIDDLAFYNCKNLNFTLPTSVTSIGSKAFMGCDSIKEIYIPKNVDCIESGAFGLMSSLEKIIVDDDNEKFFTDEDETVLISNDGVIIQYAINCDQEEFIVGYYIDYYNDGTESSPLIYNIADYAFAGAKKLKKIYIPSEIESIGKKTFAKCDNLKELNVFHSAFGDSFLLTIFGSFKDEIEVPFEIITIEEGIKTLCENLSDLFKNATNVSLPESLEHIGSNVFNKCSKLKKLIMPKNIKMIMPNTLYPETDINFSILGNIKSKDFNMLQTRTSNNYDINGHSKDNISVFSLNDGTYYVKINEFDIVNVSEDDIKNLSRGYYYNKSDPDIFIKYLIELLKINAESNHLLTNVCSNQELKNLFQKFVSDFDYAQEIAANKVSKAIREIMEQSHHNLEFLFSTDLLKKITKLDLIKILTNYNESLVRLFKLNYIDEKINIDKLIAYCKLLDKYKIYDKFLYDPIFFQKLSYNNQELLIKHFNKNIKNLLKNSQTLNDSYGDNLSDLVNLCKALGVFDDNEIISQRVTTYINEKMFDQTKNNSIVGNDIHTVFGGIIPRDEVDYEFITFFIENYDKLVEMDKINSGTIVRMYNSFREISSTSTSHKGAQRKLKVTIEKCLDFFSEKKFEGVNENNKKLARLLQQYYSEPYTLSIAEELLNQSKSAPRNIFTKYTFDSTGTAIYDNDSKFDLKEQECIDNFSYHWLPKQDYDNLILGKYCSCCAHILGAGAGIMKASMILDCCQNLVIRNKEDKIVAKMTIYVNRKQGYAVFNTTEVNTLYRNNEDINGIYKAFIRGVNEFINVYNKNNLIPISIVTIGEYRNVIKDQLGNIESELLSTPNYSDYGYSAGDRKVGTYNGDSKNKQLLVLKK